MDDVTSLICLSVLLHFFLGLIFKWKILPLAVIIFQFVLLWTVLEQIMLIRSSSVGQNCQEVNHALSTQAHLDYSTFHTTVSQAMLHNHRRHKLLCKAAPAQWTLKCKALFKKFLQNLAIWTCSIDLWIKYKKTLAALWKAILETKRYFWDNTCKNAKDSRIFLKAFRKIKSHSCSSPDSHFCLLR